jgi:DNA repair exonuclease SbcCD ATPase subunit
MSLEEEQLPPSVHGLGDASVQEAWPFGLESYSTMESTCTGEMSSLKQENDKLKDENYAMKVELEKYKHQVQCRATPDSSLRPGPDGSEGDTIGDTQESELEIAMQTIEELKAEVALLEMLPKEKSDPPMTPNGGESLGVGKSDISRRMNKELDEVKDEQEALNNVKGELDEVKSELHQVKCQRDETIGELSEVKSELHQVKYERDEAIGELSEVKLELHQVKYERDETIDELSEVKSKLARIKDEQTEVKGEQTEVKGEQAEVEASGELERVKEELDQVICERDEAREGLDEARGKLKKVEKDLSLKEAELVCAYNNPRSMPSGELDGNSCVKEELEKKKEELEEVKMELEDMKITLHKKEEDLRSQGKRREGKLEMKTGLKLNAAMKELSEKKEAS